MTACLLHAAASRGGSGGSWALPPPPQSGSLPAPLPPPQAPLEVLQAGLGARVPCLPALWAGSTSPGGSGGRPGPVIRGDSEGRTLEFWPRSRWRPLSLRWSANYHQAPF